jgi:hypothetical protein
MPVGSVMAMEEVHDGTGEEDHIWKDPERVYPMPDQEQDETQGPNTQHDPTESVHRSTPSEGAASKWPWGAETPVSGMLRVRNPPPCEETTETAKTLGEVPPVFDLSNRAREPADTAG